MLPAEPFGSLRPCVLDRAYGLIMACGDQRVLKMVQDEDEGKLSMPLSPKQEMSRLIVRAAGGVLILLCLWGGAQPGNSILFFGVLVGFLVLTFPDKLMKP